MKLYHFTKEEIEELSQVFGIEIKPNLEEMLSQLVLRSSIVHWLKVQGK